MFQNSSRKCGKKTTWIKKRPRKVAFMKTFSLAVLFYLVFVITEISILIKSLNWSYDPFLVVSHPLPLKTSIISSLSLQLIGFISFVALMINSKRRLFLYLWLITVIWNTIVPISMMCSPSLDSWINKWSDQWTNTSHTMSFQLENSCCGWQSYQDRAISECPFRSKSGCKPIVISWIYERYSQSNSILSTVAAMSLYSVIVVISCALSLPIESLWTEIEIPFIWLFFN